MLLLNNNNTPMKPKSRSGLVIGLALGAGLLVSGGFLISALVRNSRSDYYSYGY